MIYTFYGHRNTSESIRVRLKAVLVGALNDDNCFISETKEISTEW